MTLTLETTRTCRRTPLVLFLLDELDAPCEVVLREPGFFESRYHAVGPLLRDGDFELLELDAVLRHLARSRGAGALMPTALNEIAEIDRWMEVQATLRLSAVRIAAARPSPPPEDALGTLRRCLGLLDVALTERDYVLDRFTVADVPAIQLGLLAMLGLELEAWPNVARWASNVAARPSWDRAQRRLTAVSAEGAA